MAGPLFWPLNNSVFVLARTVPKRYSRLTAPSDHTESQAQLVIPAEAHGCPGKTGMASTAACFRKNWARGGAPRSARSAAGGQAPDAERAAHHKEHKAHKAVLRAHVVGLNPTIPRDLFFVPFVLLVVGLG